MIRKQFSQIDYALYDQKAKDKTTKYLQGLGYQVVEHPNRYAQDLIAKSEMNEFMVECEVKVLWKTDSFPFPNVQLPERKSKFLKERTLFFIWNEQLTRAFTFWSDDVKKLTPVEVPNKRVRKGEYFYQIPLDMTEMVEG